MQLVGDGLVDGEAVGVEAVDVEVAWCDDEFSVLVTSLVMRVGVL